MSCITENSFNMKKYITIILMLKLSSKSKIHQLLWTKWQTNQKKKPAVTKILSLSDYQYYKITKKKNTQSSGVCMPYKNLPQKFKWGYKFIPAQAWTTKSPVLIWIWTVKKCVRNLTYVFPFRLAICEHLFHKYLN